jgi:hypothetical protein
LVRGELSQCIHVIVLQNTAWWNAGDEVSVLDSKFVHALDGASEVSGLVSCVDKAKAVTQ